MVKKKEEDSFVEDEKEKFKQLLRSKKKKLEQMQFDFDPLEKVSSLIRPILQHIDDKNKIKDSCLTRSLDVLIGEYTFFLDHSVNTDQKIVRGRVGKHDFNQMWSNTDELSYNKKKENIKLGRLNKANQSLFYGCFYFSNGTGGQNIAFSEIETQKDDNVYLLYSEINKPIQLRYIGMWARCFYELKPQGLDNNIFNYYNALYSIMEEELHSSDISKKLFNAILLTDQFLHDVITRKDNGRLYKITSLIANQLMESENVDGIWYSAVHAVGAPLVALKPQSADSKLKFTKAEYYKIIDDYGCALYQAKLLKNGVLNGKEIIW